MRRLALLLVLMFGASGAYAIPQVISFVTGADMSGMLVTATFSDSSTQTVTWQTLSTDGSIGNWEGYRGGAIGTGWSLTQRGDSVSNGGPSTADPFGVAGVWTLQNDRGVGLTSLVIDALAGLIVFDIIEPASHTPGSGPGLAFFFDSWDSTGVGPSSAAYSNLFNGPDLYGTLGLGWGGTGMASGTFVRFVADTDAIPEPATLLLLTAGLLGMGLRTRVRT